MPDLDDFVDRLETLLHDSTNVDWTAAVLQEHLRRSIREYSLVDPDPDKDVVVTVAGTRDISIAALTDLVVVDAVEWPTGKWPERFVQFRLRGTTLTLVVDAAPSAVENVNVYWGKLHVVTAGAGSSTLPTRAEDVVVIGAAGYALLELARDSANAINVGGASAADRLREQGEAYLARFREQLREFGKAGRVRTSQLYTPANPEPNQETVAFGP